MNCLNQYQFSEDRKPVVLNTHSEKKPNLEEVLELSLNLSRNNNYLVCSLPTEVKLLNSKNEIFEAMKYRYQTYKNTEFAQYFNDPQEVIF